ncbi:MAG TPA: O-methyltransferase [Vicinamibacterales bacterium]|nr:O-methyltransferase [Vicinamibacterales bacterium]
MSTRVVARACFVFVVSSWLLLLAPRAQAQIPSDVVNLLTSIRKIDTGQLSVSEEDGRFMRVLVMSIGAKHALEIGSAYGYSAIWIGLGLRQTGGRLTTIEYDAGRAKAARENIRRAGLTDTVTVISGDAFKEIPKIPGTFDFVFLDAWKPDYKKFFDLVFPRLTPRGLFLAHNVVNKQSEMKDFLAAIADSPSLATSIVRPGSEGMSVTVKLK